MLSFQEYASEKLILELLIKERVKVALKNKLQNVSPVITSAKVEKSAHLTVSEQMSLIMPPRDTWHRPSLRERKNDDGAEKSRKQILTRSIAITIKQHRKNPEAYPYLKRLDEFIAMLRDEINQITPLEFNSIKITGKKKKVASDGTIILRPLCSFESLKEKLLIAMASKYLSEIFDPLLHEEILSYRPLRIYHNSDQPVITDRDNAIENLKSYCSKHRNKPLYMVECDIQKYFDTINHDVIRESFGRFVEKIRQQHPDFSYDSVGRVVDAYLNSYSFYKNVEVENEHLGKSAQPRRYEGPKKEQFVERGCYSEQELDESLGKIGIPQGGALSGLISNVVLSTVDMESVLKERDPRRFFCRYGDDIILIHTSKEKCKALIDKYCAMLTKSKLLYHDFVSVADPMFRLANGATRTILWDQKSRAPYLWGRSSNDAESVDWIGFLGYEVRYTGEVRMRRSSLNDKFKGIKRKYHGMAKTKLAKGEDNKNDFEAIEARVLCLIERFVGDGLSSAKSLNENKYSVTQALKLNQYTSRHIYKLLYKIVKKNNLGDDVLAQWWQIAKDKGCKNYLKTLKEL